MDGRGSEGPIDRVAEGVGVTEVVGLTLTDLVGDARERAVPVLKEGFVGVYRWHAKRTLREVPTVRAAEVDGTILGVSLLDWLAPEVGYVYYLSVGRSHRQRGIGGLLLDDALGIFRRGGATVVYGAVEEDNQASLALFRSRGFRMVERKETSYRDGGLGAWGLRSRMWLVGGEVLLGLRLVSASSSPPA
jgi:ribosomal protein S18 acetylase RimI-like enzyme